jgi:hypothetical protein
MCSASQFLLLTLTWCLQEVLDELRGYMEECASIEASCRAELVDCRAQASQGAARLALHAAQVQVMDQMRQQGAQLVVHQ